MYPINFISITIAQETIINKDWASGTPLPTSRTEVTSANLDDDVYVIGGFTSDGETTDIVEMYNATSDTWRTDIAPLPVPLHHAASVPFQDKIYVIGGYTDDWTPSDRLLVYDPTTNEWTQSSVMPTARGSPNAHFVNETLYVIGGDADEQSLNVVESYNVVERYDPSSGSWTTDLEPMSSKRSGIAANNVNGLIYVLGGEQNQGTFDDNERYDPVNNTWTIESSMLTVRHGLGVTSLDDRIFVIGDGPQPGLTVSDANEIYLIGKTS